MIARFIAFALPHGHVHTSINTHAHSFSPPLSLSPTATHTLSLSHKHTLSPTHKNTRTHTQTHTHTHTYTHTYIHTCTHAYTYTHKHTLTHTHTLSLSLSLCFSLSHTHIHNLSLVFSLAITYNQHTPPHTPLHTHTGVNGLHGLVACDLSVIIIIISNTSWQRALSFFKRALYPLSTLNLMGKAPFLLESQIQSSFRSVWACRVRPLSDFFFNGLWRTAQHIVIFLTKRALQFMQRALQPVKRDLYLIKRALYREMSLTSCESHIF